MSVLTHHERRALAAICASKAPVLPSDLAFLLAGTMEGVGGPEFVEARELIVQLAEAGLVRQDERIDALAVVATPEGRARSRREGPV